MTIPPFDSGRDGYVLGRGAQTTGGRAGALAMRHCARAESRARTIPVYRGQRRKSNKDIAQYLETHRLRTTASCRPRLPGRGRRKAWNLTLTTLLEERAGGKAPTGSRSEAASRPASSRIRRASSCDGAGPPDWDAHCAAPRARQPGHAPRSTPAEDAGRHRQRKLHGVNLEGGRNALALAAIMEGELTTGGANDLSAPLGAGRICGTGSASEADPAGPLRRQRGDHQTRCRQRRQRLPAR